MSVMVLSPRLTIAESIPLRSPNARPAVVYAFFGLFIVGILVGAALADGVLYRAALAGVAIVIALFLLYLHALVSATSPGAIRVRREGTLRYMPPPTVLLMPLLISLVGIVPGALAVLAGWLTEDRFGAGQGSIWLTIMFGASVLWLLKQAWDLQVPYGLELSPSGLVGVRGTTSVRIAWEDLNRAVAVSSSTGVKLQLSATNRTTLTIDGPHIGSDPNVVAAMIEHFRTHPEARETLTDVHAAIRSVEN